MQALGLACSHPRGPKGYLSQARSIPTLHWSRFSNHLHYFHQDVFLFTSCFPPRPPRLYGRCLRNSQLDRQGVGSQLLCRWTGELEGNRDPGDETLKLLKDPRGALRPFPENTFSITDATSSRPSFNGAKVDHESSHRTTVCTHAFCFRL